MRRLPLATVALLAIGFVQSPGNAQAPSDGRSPWQLGAGIGLGANEPTEAFSESRDSCRPHGVLPAISLAGRHSVLSWLDVALTGSHHQDLTRDCGFVTPDVARAPGTYADREYPDRIRGGADYFATSGRILVDPFQRTDGVRPVFIAGIGRIWGKEINYPELGLGTVMPLGELTLRVAALGRRLTVPFDSVTTRVSQEFEVTELSRISLEEDHIPILFRIGVGWRP